MNLLTTSSKSYSLMLALTALTTTTASASTQLDTMQTSLICDGCSRGSSFESISSSSSTVYKSIPIIHNNINLPSISNNDRQEEEGQYNVSAFYADDIEEEDDDEIELPAELAALIESAKKSSPTAAPTRDVSSKSGVRYYATYTNGQSCTSKSSSDIESWEESFATLDECCDMNFSWDYDSCILEV